MEFGQTNVFIGIDPGQKGGIAALYSNKIHPDIAYRYPGDVLRAAHLLCDLAFVSAFGTFPIGEIVACVEKVSSMPKQGVASSFKFGANYGAWLGMLSAYQIKHITVTPRTWQKAMLDAGTGETKERSLQMARRLVPKIDMKHKADDGKADALHLARYAKTLHERGEL